MSFEVKSLDTPKKPFGVRFEQQYYEDRKAAGYRVPPKMRVNVEKQRGVGKNKHSGKNKEKGKKVVQHNPPKVLVYRDGKYRMEFA